MKQIWPKKEDKKPLFFSDVKINQLFIEGDGWLCAKTSKSSCLYLADESGLPNFNVPTPQYRETDEIKEILPLITKLGIVELSDD